MMEALGAYYFLLAPLMTRYKSEEKKGAEVLKLRDKLEEA